MTLPELTVDVVANVLNSEDSYPVLFCYAAKWLGYKTKASAKRTLIDNFAEGFDFVTERESRPSGGRPMEIIKLTIDCFKQFCMMAGTEKGFEVRRYFIECETKLKAMEKGSATANPLPAKPEPSVLVCPLSSPAGDNAKLIELAHRYQFGGGESGKARCREWIRSVGIGDDEWVQYSSPRDVRLPRQLLPRLDEEIKKLRCPELATIAEPIFIEVPPDDPVIQLYQAVAQASDVLSKVAYLRRIEQTESLAIDLANEVLDRLIHAGAMFCGNADDYHWTVGNVLDDQLSNV